MKTLARILVVEDDPADARLVLDALTQLTLDQQTLVVPDGAQALDYLYARGRFQGRPPGLPAAILLDIKMPGLDGLQVLKHIRADPTLRAIPVVMLTASRQERDLRRAYELGATGYFVKSINANASAASVRAFAQFFAVANEPPPGCLRPPWTPPTFS